MIHNYNQNIVVNGYNLSGISSFNGGYSISNSPVAILGTNENLYSVVSAPIVANFNLQRVLTYADPLLSFTGSNLLSGNLSYEGRYFGFNNGCINSYVVNAGVNAVPTLSTNLSLYGTFGSGISQASTNSHPAIYKTQRGAIFATINNNSTDAIISFSISYQFNKVVQYELTNNHLVEIIHVPPVLQNIQFDVELDSYEAKKVQESVYYRNRSDLTFNIKDRGLSHTLFSDSVQDADLVGFEISSNAGNKSVYSLSYQKYLI